GEVQEMIDVSDFAVEHSSLLYGLTISSERKNHRLMEQCHPFGLVAVITAFNFPVAVWSWNAALAAVCGDATIWKPSEKTPLTASAVTKIVERVCRETGADPAIFSLLMGDRKTVGQKLADDARIPLISATGSVAMGLNVAKTVHGRLGKTIMELGGNNALIVCPTADLEMATQSIFFGAVGTAGQRCTSTRRVIMHESVADKVRKKLLAAYKSLTIGNPLDRKTLMGPMIDKGAVDMVQDSIQKLKDEGGEVLYGGERMELSGGCYMKPCLANAKPNFKIVQEETFGPLLYLLTYRDFDEAIAIQNGVPQGLTSSIFTNDVREAEKFVSAVGSDCGIANVNTGTSGAEIGGAFGGEKNTGGGRESGSDSWKSYMRRQTNTINFSSELPLAQVIQFFGHGITRITLRNIDTGGVRLAFVGGDRHAARLEFWKERFELVVGHHSYLVHDRNQFFIEHAFFFELQWRYHSIDQSDGHAIRQRMISGLFGVRPIFVRIAQNVGSARDHFDFDLLHVVGLDLVFLDRLHHRGQRRMTERFDRETLHPAIENAVVRLR